jgi:MFS family permease
VSSQVRTNARRIALARLISLAGSSAAAVALLYVVFQRTGSAGWVSAALLATLGVRGLTTPVGGVLGDRLDRRRLMILSDVSGSIAFLAMAFLRGPASLLVVAFLASAVESPFFPAASAAVPNLVPVDELAWANSTIAFGSNVGYLIGPAMGGVLVAAVGAPAVFAANAVTFLLSAVLVWSVRAPFAVERSERETPGGILVGLRHVWSDRPLRLMALAAAVFAMTVGSILVAELPLATAFGTGAVGYGLLSTAFGAGALVGSLGGRFLTGRRKWTVVVLGPLITAIGFGSVGLAPVFGFVLGAMVVSGLSDGIVDVGFELVFQERSPDAIRSRVIGLLETTFLVGLAISFPIGGWLTDALGPRAAYVVAGAGTAISSLIMWPLLMDRPVEPVVLPALEGAGP